MPRPDPVGWSDEQAARWAALADELRRRLGPGTPVPAAERASLQPWLGGADLSGAVLHRGPLAGSLARAVGGEAVAVGRHVLGAAADLDAGTPRGAALLGHELTHALRRGSSGRPAVPPVQRTAPGAVAPAHQDEEAVAQQVETALLSQAAQPAAAASAPISSSVDAEALADRVYRRLVDHLVLERERAAWLG